MRGGSGYTVLGAELRGNGAPLWWILHEAAATYQGLAFQRDTAGSSISKGPKASPSKRLASTRLLKIIVIDMLRDGTTYRELGAD